MTINPRDYDLDELRKMAREKGDSPMGPPGEADGEETVPSSNGFESLESTAARDQFQSGLYRELLPLEAGADDLEKPYLDGLPETYAAEFTVFEWLEFLLSNFGYKGTNEALQYYEAVGWITEDVESTLNDYLLGIEGVAPEDGGSGDVDDHMLSLVYIARLVSMR